MMRCPVATSTSVPALFPAALKKRIAQNVTRKHDRDNAKKCKNEEQTGGFAD